MTIGYWFTNRWREHILRHDSNTGEWFVAHTNHETLDTIRTLSTRTRMDVVMRYYVGATS